MRYVSLVAAVFLVCLLRAARGDYLPESAFHGSVQIVRMRVTEAVLTQRDFGGGIEDWGLEMVGRVLETIKGDAVEEIRISATGTNGEKIQKVQVGEELLYLMPAIDPTQHNLFSSEPAQRYPILMKVGGDGTPLLRDEGVVDHSFKRLAPALLIERLREERKKNAGPRNVFRIGHFYVSSPKEVSPADDMYIVDGPELGPLVEEWAHATNPFVRSFAVHAMEEVALPGREALLRSLLNDPWNIERLVFESPWSNLYPIRMEAREQLLKLGVPEAELSGGLLQSPAAEYGRVRVGWIVTALAGLGIVGVSGMRAVSGSWWVAVKRSAVAMLVVTGLFLTCAWWRSAWIADDFTVARPGALLSVTSYQGGLQILWVNCVDAATPLVHRAMVPTEGGGCVILPTSHIFWHSLGSAFGMGSQPKGGIYSVGYQADFSMLNPVGVDSGNVLGRRWQVPYWVLIAFCFALPAFVGGRAGVVALRARRRGRAGRCAGCGYDVRVQRAGGVGRCPECGRGWL